MRLKAAVISSMLDLSSRLVAKTKMKREQRRVMIERRILIIGECMISEIADDMVVRGVMSRKAIKRCSKRGLYTLLPPLWSNDLMRFCAKNYFSPC